MVVAFMGITLFKPQDDKCIYKYIFKFSGPQYLNSAGKQELSRILHSRLLQELLTSYVGRITRMPRYLNVDFPLVSIVQLSVSQPPDS